MILAIVMTDRASLHSMISSQKMCRLLCSLKLWRKTNLCFLKVFLNWAIWNSYLKPSRKDSRKIEPPSTLASNSPIEWSCQMWNLRRENPLFSNFEPNRYYICSKMDAFVTFFESFRVWMFDVLRWIFRIWLVGKYVLEKFLPRKHISGAATLCTKLNSMSKRNEDMDNGVN